MNIKNVKLVLRIAVFGEFLGHGVLALQGKQAWIGWLVDLLGVTPETATQLLLVIGASDVVVALIVLFYPIRVVLLWAALWGAWTALVRPIVGEPIWDFVERWANWGAPLALLLLQGLPKKAVDWLRASDEK